MKNALDEEEHAAMMKYLRTHRAPPDLLQCGCHNPVSHEKGSFLETLMPKSIKRLEKRLLLEVKAHKSIRYENETLKVHNSQVISADPVRCLHP